VASYVVGMKGQVWAFGSNRSMELGARKEVAQISSAQRMKSVRGVHAVQVVGSNSASGQSHAMVLGANGEVQTFGASSTGALGQGPDVRQTSPLLLRFSAQVKVKMLCAGARHSLLLTDDGKLFSMGDNAHGQLGIEGKAVPMVDSPTAVGGPLGDEDVRVKLVSAGDNFTCAVTEDDQLYTWGGNSNGQLALGKLTDQPLPCKVPQLSGLGIGHICCGARHALAVTNNGSKVWSWGSNVQGQLGIGQTHDGYQRTLPTLVQVLSNKKGIMVVQVAAASYHSLALTGSGEVYAFGLNSHGQLGFPPVRSAVTKSDAGDPTQLSQYQMVQQQSKKKQTGAGATHDNGVENLWLPARIVSLQQYRVNAVSTADMHTLTIAQHHHG